MKLQINKLLLTAALTAVLGTAQAATAEDVEQSFYPYKNGGPALPAGLSAGSVINSGNVEQYKAIVDPAMYQFIKDGWTEIKVTDTTSFDLNEEYVKATREGAANVSLGEKVGQINGFVAGRPFPEDLSTSDPRAGEKAAWNFKYGYNWGDNAAIYPFYWTFRDMNTGKKERVIKFNFHFLNWMHRVNHEPKPNFPDNPSGLFRSIYAEVLEPFDVKNTQLLIHRYEDDLKRDDAWLYLGFQRRVRRLASGQITDAFLGSDLMIEDFEGYNGRIADMKWTFKGAENVMLPFYNHDEAGLTDEYNDPDGYKFVSFSGKGGCYPDVQWQLRKAYVVEAEPVDPNHPISKRIHYMDAQTYTIPRTLIYDRKGDLWKSFQISQAHPDRHLPKNKGTGVAIDDAVTMIDVQSAHCTTAQFKGQVDPALNPQNLFTVQNLRARGN